jgi:hypothetical protein
MPSKAEKVEVYLAVHVLQRLQTNILLNILHKIWFLISVFFHVISSKDILSEQKDCSNSSNQLL